MMHGFCATMVDFISKNEKPLYKEEEWLIDWCIVNNLSLNMDTTKEMVFD